MKVRVKGAFFHGRCDRGVESTSATEICFYQGRAGPNWMRQAREKKEKRGEGPPCGIWPWEGLGVQG